VIKEVTKRSKKDKDTKAAAKETGKK